MLCTVDLIVADMRKPLVKVRLCERLLLWCRYAMFLAFLALSILCSEGWIGPVTCLVALILPPEIKSFGVSLWSAVATVLIMPAGNVIFSIYLTVRCLLILRMNSWMSSRQALCV